MSGELIQDSSVVFTKGIAQSFTRALDSFLGSPDFLAFLSLVVVAVICFYFWGKAKRS